MSDDNFKVEGLYYFVPGFNLVYSEQGLQKLVKAGSTVAGSACRITGSVDLLIAFKPELFNKGETFHLRASNIIIEPKPFGDVNAYRGIMLLNKKATDFDGDVLITPSLKR